MRFALPLLPFTYMKPSAPAPADLLMTIHGFGDSLYLVTSGEMNRAMTSAPPPVPAGNDELYRPVRHPGVCRANGGEHQRQRACDDHTDLQP